MECTKIYNKKDLFIKAQIFSSIGKQTSLKENNNYYYFSNNDNNNNGDSSTRS